MNLFYNIETEDGVLKSTCAFNDYFIKKINNNELYNRFYTQNEDVLRKIIYLIDYEYFDYTTNENSIRYFIFDSDYNFYEFDFNKVVLNKLDYRFNNLPQIVKEDGCLYLYSENGAVVIFDNQNPQYYDDVFKIKNYFKFDNYLFFTNEKYPFCVFYTEKTELINLNNNIEFYNKIEMNINDGRVLKIAKYKDEVYIFQQYKITAYNVYSSKNIFSNSCFLNSRIIDNTICQIDDYIVFLTTSGLKYFDGNDVEDIFSQLTNKLNFNYDKIFSFSYESKYFLNSELCINDELKNVLIEIDIENLLIYFHDLNLNINNYHIIQNQSEYKVVIFSSNEAKHCVLFLDKENRTQNLKFVKFDKIYFDSSETKQIILVKFNSKGSFKYKILTDKETGEFEISDEIKELKIDIKGLFFEFQIESKEDFSIESIYLDVMTIEDRL